MIRRHLTYANVTATLALVLAAGTGAVYAAGEIGSRELENNSVRTQDLKDRRGVKGEDVRRNTLGGSEIREEALEWLPDSQVSRARRLTATHRMRFSSIAQRKR